MHKKCMFSPKLTYIFVFIQGRVNSNLQDFRHECTVFGGRSKCHICEDIICSSETGTCPLQIQGVNTSEMSINIPTVSDDAWAVGGRYKHDYGGNTTSHYCVLLTGGKCIDPFNTDFSGCITRCFGYGFNQSAIKYLPSARSNVDIYPGMTQWPGQSLADLWALPRNCSELDKYEHEKCTYSGVWNKNPSFNPQGYAFTVAGNGEAGFHDGNITTARFNLPGDVAVDAYGNIFVADTGNNAIRVITITGQVITIAGRGPNHPGDQNGDCKNATFSNPMGLDVRYEMRNNRLTAVIIVADTGNHKIRRILYHNETKTCTVECLTGLCGNNTLSASLSKTKATPKTGYSDGDQDEARFSAPQGVAFMDGIYEDFFTVADTGNFLIRWVVAENGTTYTLAGSVIPGQRDVNGDPLPGCVPPCLQGNPGFRDGNLTYTQFYNPVDVTRGPNNTIWVTDEQRLRMITLPFVNTSIYSIQSMGHVFTIAGTSLQGTQDGIAQDSTFFYSSGAFVDSRGVAYVSDSMTCRVRRVTPYPLVSQTLTCSSQVHEYIRPSGCVSYDMPIDKVGRKISRVEGNIQYNYGWPYEEDTSRGMYIKNCVGVPPFDTLDKHFILQEGDNLVIDDDRTVVNEDSEQGMTILFTCPAQCVSQAAATDRVYGTKWYADNSSVCLAAIHDGAIKASTGGLIQILLERRDYLNSVNVTYSSGSYRHGIQSFNVPASVHRVFSILPFNVSNNMVHSIAGSPSAPLENGCGFREGQPATYAKFNRPGGVAARYGHTLSDSEYLYIADTNNHRVRAVSAVCTFVCENGGRCVGDDTCSCPTGWTGIDCSLPVCSVACGTNSVCVSPGTCGCKPGYTGTNCDQPLCSQTCLNGGTCTAPDTCTCPFGWFDTNCTTPVCDITCGNGGNCTGPNLCACPKEWTGADCRTPVCNQTCLNGGHCVAPDTCLCTPHWTNYDCSAPICHQGYFEAYPGTSNPKTYWSVTKYAIPTYKNCDLQSWCNATNEFECDQTEMQYGQLSIPYGPVNRYITGRKVIPKACTNIELSTTFKIPFQLLYSDNSTTPYMRFSPTAPYTSNDANLWRGYLSPTAGHTGPWRYSTDRQIPYVNLMNATQGRYVCANGGVCVAPEICSCADGWSGFDCRTPICEQGYYYDEQDSYVSGLKTKTEVRIFEKYMGNNTYRLQWPYSNPNFTVQFEQLKKIADGNVTHYMVDFKGRRYLGPVNITDYDHIEKSYQGGYRCSIRAYTEWENEFFLFSHPNFFSQYMDKRVQADNLTYTFWVNMSWPPVHQHSRILDQYFANLSFAFTKEGWRRRGIWNRTENFWEFGVCILEFERNCTTSTKELDLESGLYGVLVQDTDLSYRPRIYYTDEKVIAAGRWDESSGKCVDQVVRGCHNNGTCIAPNTCRCATGWKGSNCNIPICEQDCQHNGNCTSPNVCTCERGWEGYDCSVPICAQECNNGGLCVAPDTCKCHQFDNAFTDNRVAGGRPLFQDYDGSPLRTGWTGYDCSIPICVQAETFITNVASSSASGYETYGGRGADGELQCVSTTTGETLPRCPMYNLYITGNDGRSWQTGCGWDPYDTGCCIRGDGTAISCYVCDSSIQVVTNETFYCAGEFSVTTGFTSETQRFAQFLDDNLNFLICGQYHQPRDHALNVVPEDYGTAKYYVDVLNPEQTNYNFRSNWTSNRFLCNVQEWIQGDYIDDADLGDVPGMGSVYGLKKGRHVRINTPNIIIDSAAGTFTRGDVITGEGIYACYNGGSCISPDICTCEDGYSGYDCSTPLCRHLQPSGSVSSCLNGGICVSKDNCNCVQTTSVLWVVHSEAPRGVTGWTGTDCSMPMCSQGYYDPFCTDLPQAPGGEGCYRCANGGNCTAPDVCTCATGWTGYDCKTPVCETVADPLTRTQLGTVFENNVISFEADPCAVRAIHGIRGWKGRKYTRGNCTQPNQCTCLCKLPYNRKACKSAGDYCDGPFQDPLVAVRNLLVKRGPEFVFGSTDCRFGFEGNVNYLDQFTTCHQTIYLPSLIDGRSLALIVGFSVVGFFAILFYRFASVRIKRRFLLAKIERRKTKRSSEESLMSAGSGGFNAN